MIKNSWKKSLVVAGVLTALCASSALAAEKSDNPHRIRDRVETILCEEDSTGRHGINPHMRGPMNPGPQLTKEQADAMRTKRAEWKKMTPEQRQKVREERMKNMTPEQKERFEQREKKMKEWRNMTPEQRQEAREKAKAKWDSMSDAEKAAAKEHFKTNHPRQGHHKGQYRNNK